MHEVVKEHSLAAGKVVKEEGLDNDLLERLAGDDRIPFSLDELMALVGDYTQFTGRASAQTDEYIREIIVPLLAAREGQMGEVDSSLSV
jgi:adenylosuccinate lyase